MGRFNYNLISAVCVGALALTGCHDTDDSTLAANPPTPSAPTSTVSGTAAVGQAVSGAHVVLTCGGGHTYGKAAPLITTNSGGVYTAKVRTDSLPCAAAVSGGTLPAGVTLHSVTTTNGAQVPLNITPLTDLVLIKALQHGSVDAASWLAHPVATNLPNAEAIASATAALKTAFTAKGYVWPTTPNFNPLTSKLTPELASDLYDTLLDALGRALNAAASDYPALVSSFIGGGSLPTAPVLTPPSEPLTCASITKPKAALSDLTPFVGTYQVKIGSSTTATPLTIATNGNITLNGQTATASDVCGPFVQSNGQGLLILASKTTNFRVNVFKDTAGKITTEGPDFTGSPDYFFGEKGTTPPVTPPVTPPTTPASNGILGKVYNTVLPGDYVLQCSEGGPIGATTPINVTIKADGSSTLNGQPLVDATHKGTSTLEFHRDLSSTLTSLDLKIEQHGGNYVVLGWKADGSFYPNSAFVNDKVQVCYSHTGHTAPSASSQVVSAIPTLFTSLPRSETLSSCSGLGSTPPGAQQLIVTAAGTAQFGSDAFTANHLHSVTDKTFFAATSSSTNAVEFADASNLAAVRTLAITFDHAYKTTSATSNANGFLSCTP